jgi:hypothetical protein
MNCEEIQLGLDTMADLAGDPAKAHMLEDALYLRFVEEAAAGRCSRKAATLLLKSKHIRFPRWYE